MSKIKGSEKIFKEFCENTSLNSCSFLTVKRTLKSERIIWILINILLIILTAVLIDNLWVEYTDNPTVTYLASSNLPFYKIKHPAVSICSLNKISKKSAFELAKRLKKFNKAKNISVLLDSIKLLGNFYDLNTDMHLQFTKFEEELEQFDNSTETNEGIKRLLQLTPPCKDILKHCEWGGKVYKCEQLFFTRMTFEGFCCVFNYIRPYNRDDLYESFNNKMPNKLKVPQGPGIENGLQVTLNNNQDDYFYKAMETSGFNIHIFYPEDYPDKLSGSLTEVILSLGLEALINIDVDVIQASPAVKIIPVETRKCKFEQDDHTVFGRYRESDCYVTCRMESMKSLCNCIPFTLPNKYGKAGMCTLTDIPCLNKYKEKWSRYYPQHLEMEDLQQEMQDSISCPHCLPPCNTVQYKVYTSFGRMNRLQRSKNITRMTIFFSKAFANLYKIDITNTWFEVLSSFGGTLSLFIGFSLISAIEIIVLLCKLILHLVSK